MKEELAKVLSELGTDGLQAFYIYLIVDYVSLWITIGLCVWGIRTMWKKYKEDIL
jgi:hypothetical protein